MCSLLRDATLPGLCAGPSEVAFDRLVIATGANPIELPGQADIDGVSGLRTVQDAAPMTRSVGGEVGSVLLELHRRAGTAVRLGVTVSGFEERDGRVSAVLLDDATRIGGNERSERKAAQSWLSRVWKSSRCWIASRSSSPVLTTGRSSSSSARPSRYRMVLRCTQSSSAASSALPP